MISYAQNAEDVVLARVFTSPTGFYVDAGASHPDYASVTRHFYDIGWRGINVEPRSDAHALLVRRRPRDINLKVALGEREGSTELYLVTADLDLSTTDLDDLEFLRRSGYREYRVETVKMVTLSQVLEEHHVERIDFLKVDTEGSEEAVLRGLDLGRWRPRVIVVEAIRPWSRERSDHLWRHLLEQQGYREGLFDGVNLFFAAQDDEEAHAQLQPASALDRYTTAEVADLRAAVRRLQAALELEQRAAVTEQATTVGPPPPLARVAVIGSPFSGGAWLARALAGALGAEALMVEHPADVEWDCLPERVVIQCCWPRSLMFERRLAASLVTVVSLARHPLEVAAALTARGADLRSEDILGLLEVTASWWNSPATVRVRYEDLAADPAAGVEAVLMACGQKPPELQLPEWVPEPGGGEVLHAQLPSAVERRLRGMVDGLGYRSCSI
jgi:FkbM family methyltransferase